MPFYVCMAAAKPAVHPNQLRSSRKVDRMGEVENFGNSAKPAWMDLLREMAGVAAARQLGPSLMITRFGSALGHVCRAHGIFRTINSVSGLVLGRTSSERRRRRRQTLAFANRILNVAGVEIAPERRRPENRKKDVVNIGQVLVDGESLER